MDTKLILWGIGCACIVSAAIGLTAGKPPLESTCKSRDHEREESCAHEVARTQCGGGQEAYQLGWWKVDGQLYFQVQCIPPERRIPLPDNDTAG